MNFVDKDGTTKVYIPVHPCALREDWKPKLFFWISEEEYRIHSGTSLSFKLLKSYLILLNLYLLATSRNFELVLWPALQYLHPEDDVQCTFCRVYVGRCL